MAVTVFPPSADIIGDVRSALTVPVVQAEGTRTVVALPGETDVTARPALCDVFSRVIASGTGDVVIDLTGSTFIDTASVRVFATARQLLDRQGRNLTFRAPSRLAVRVLDLFGLTGLVESSEQVQP
jgi:anti-sigma B factor antagonist